MSLPISLSDAVVPDTDAAVQFLAQAHPGGPIHLVAIYESGRVEARTFDVADPAGISQWLDRRQGNANLYWSVNELKAGVANVKAKRADVLQCCFLHVDIDDGAALERLRQFSPAPTVILFSGGGFQGFWALSEPCTDIDRVERVNAAVARLLGGDSCHNADRIMRLPGTINMPNAKKRAAGRVPALARVVEADWSRVYSIDDFPLDDPPPETPAAAAMSPVIPIGIEELPDNVSPWIRLVIELGDDPERPRDSDAPRFPSRSEAVFSVACDLKRAGCANETVAGILVNPQLGISASILEKGNPVAYALRQARSAEAATSNGWPDPDKKGNPRASMRNAVVAIRRLGLSCAFDLFRHRKMVGGKLLEDHQGEISDDACMVLRGIVIEHFGFDPRSEHVRDAINLLCLENAFHPIRQMLDALVWDGVPRLDRWLTTYLGAEDTPLNSAVSRIVLIAAVRRVRQPGVKFDQIVVFEGPQGIGKSTAIGILAGPSNHSDQEILTADAKTQMELMEGVWIYELGEIEGFNKAEVNKIKAFASRAVDRSRMAYAHYAVSRPRQAIFIGTTNDSKYLRDVTGNRRFWPVKLGTIALEALRRDRDQLLAEAAHRERQGESIELPRELWAAAAAEQAARMEEDPWIEKLATERGKAYGDVVRVSTSDLMAALEIPFERQNHNQTKRLAIVMHALGWTQTKFRVGDATLRGYERPKPDDHRDKQDF